MYDYFKSIIDQDRCSVVICNLDHRIIYMNPAAVINYEKYGGEALVGQNLLNCHNEKSCERIRQVVDWFSQSSDNNIIYTSHDAKRNKDIYMVALRDKEGQLIGYYEKHEYRKPEAMKRYDMQIGETEREK